MSELLHAGHFNDSLNCENKIVNKNIAVLLCLDDIIWKLWCFISFTERHTKLANWNVFFIEVSNFLNKNLFYYSLDTTYKKLYFYFYRYRFGTNFLLCGSCQIYLFKWWMYNLPLTQNKIALFSCLIFILIFFFLFFFWFRTQIKKCVK